MNRLSTVALLSLLAAPALACHHIGKPPVLSQERIGAVTFGASLQSVEASLKEHVSRQVRDPQCSMVAFKAYPGTLFMVEQGRITRADAAPSLPNQLGVKVGDSRSAVLKRFPQLQVTPHKYLSQGSVLKLASSDGKAALILETDALKILSIRAGLEPSVSYVERCS